MDSSTFVHLWQVWDDHCATDAHYYESELTRCPPTDRFEDACREIANALGLPVTRLRTKLAKNRIAGMSSEDALAQISAIHDLV